MLGKRARKRADVSGTVKGDFVRRGRINNQRALSRRQRRQAFLAFDVHLLVTEKIALVAERIVAAGIQHQNLHRGCSAHVVEQICDLVRLNLKVVGGGEIGIDRNDEIFTRNLNRMSAVVEQRDVAIVQRLQKLTDGFFEPGLVEILTDGDFKIRIAQNRPDTLGVIHRIRKLGQSLVAGIADHQGRAAALHLAIDANGAHGGESR